MFDKIDFFVNYKADFWGKMGASASANLVCGSGTVVLKTSNIFVISKFPGKLFPICVSCQLTHKQAISNSKSYQTLNFLLAMYKCLLKSFQCLKLTEGAFQS